MAFPEEPMAVEKKLTVDDAQKLSALVSELEAARAKYGSHIMAFEDLKLQNETEARHLRAYATQKAQDLQAFSQVLLHKYGIPTDQGSWTLNTTTGMFHGPVVEKPLKSSKRR